MDKSQLKRKCDHSNLAVDLSEYTSSDQLTRTLVNQGNYQIALLEEILNALKEPKVSYERLHQEIRAHDKASEPKQQGFMARLFGR